MIVFLISASGCISSSSVAVDEFRSAGSSNSVVEVRNIIKLVQDKSEFNELDKTVNDHYITEWKYHMDGDHRYRVELMIDRSVNEYEVMIRVIEQDQIDGRWYNTPPSDKATESLKQFKSMVEYYINF